MPLAFGNSVSYTHNATSSSLSSAAAGATCIRAPGRTSLSRCTRCAPLSSYFPSGPSSSATAALRVTRSRPRLEDRAAAERRPTHAPPATSRALRASADRSEHKPAGEHAAATTASDAGNGSGGSAKRGLHSSVRTALVNLPSASTNAEACALLDSAKSDSALRKWRSQPLSRRSVSEQEVRSLMPGVNLRRLGARGSNVDVRNLFVGTLLGSTVLYFLTVLIPGNVGATLQYLSLLIPVGLLSLGSLAPGVLGAAVNRASRLRPGFRKRLAAHEAGHIVTGYITGVPVRSVNVDGAMDSAVALYDLAPSTSGDGDTGAADDKAGTVRVTESFLNALAVTSLGGVLGEYLGVKGGSGGGDPNKEGAEGGFADVQQLQSILSTLEPDNRQEHRGIARWAALMAYTVLKNERVAFDAVCSALEDRRATDMAQLAEIIEAAESTR